MHGEVSELAEGARLEIVCRVNSSTEGSNPSLSARKGMEREKRSPCQGFSASADPDKSGELLHLSSQGILAVGQRPCAAAICELRQVRKEATVSVFSGCRSKLLSGCKNILRRDRYSIA